jgi:hypothetical protein
MMKKTYTCKGSTGGTTGSGNGTLIFYCNTSDIGTNANGNSSCTATGGTSSSCSSSSSGTSSGAVKAWEMTTSNQTLENALVNAETCAEAVEAAGNCSPSGGDSKIIYTCKY